MSVAGRLAAIHIHPIKSCRSTSLTAVEVAATGLAGDREWQVVDGAGTPVTQRQDPVLATVRPTPVPGGLRIAADGIDAVEVERPTATDVTVHALSGLPVEAGDAGDEAARWFTALLGRPARLVALVGHGGFELPVPGIDQPITWVDAAPVSVTNTASLAWLNERASAPFGMDRFRANLVVETDDPWIEDTWRDFTIGAARLGLGLAWPRCAIPQVDQTTGDRHEEPAKALRTHRWCTSAPGLHEVLRSALEGNALFGIACTLGPPGTTLRIGDEVTVTATADPVIAPPA